MADDNDIMGILSIVLAFVFFPAGLVLGIIGYRSRKKQNQSTTLSLIGLILNIVIILIIVLVFAISFILAINQPEREGCFVDSASIFCNAPLVGISKDTNNVAIINLGLRNVRGSPIIIEDIALAGSGSCGNINHYQLFQTNGDDFDPPNTIGRNEGFILKITCASGSYRENKDFIDTFVIKYTDTATSSSGLTESVRAVAKT